jgi:hypothetical protein
VTKYIIFAGTDDGYIDSSSATYSTARAGTGTNTVTNGSTQAPVGQSKLSSTYHAYEYFLTFDTTAIPTTDVLASADFIAYVNSVSGWTPSRGYIRCFKRPWTTPVDATDWFAGASLNGVVKSTPVNGTLSAGQKFHLAQEVAKGQVNPGATTQMVMASDGLANGTAPTASEWVWIATAESANPPVLVVQTFKPSFALGTGRAMAQLSTGQTIDLESSGSTSTLSPSLVYYDRGTNTSHTIAAAGSMLFPQLNANSVLTTEILSVVVDKFDNIYVIGPRTDFGSMSIGIFFIKSGGVGSLTWSAPVLKVETFNLDGVDLVSLSATMIKALNASVGAPPVPAGVEIDRDIIITFITRAESATSTVGSRSRFIIANTTSLHSNVAVGAMNSFGDSVWIKFDSGYANAMMPADTYVGNVHISVIGAPDDSFNPKSWAAAYLYEAGNGGTATLKFVVFVVSRTATGAYTVSANGASGGAANATYSYPSFTTTLSADSMPKLIATKASFFCLAGLQGGAPIMHVIANAGGYQDRDYLQSALLTTVDTSQSGAWDAFYDPVADTIWFYTLNTGVAGEIDRIPFRCTTNRWDDANSVIVTTTAPTTGTNVYLKMTQKTVDERFAHLVVLNNNAGVLTQSVIVDGFNIAPNAPNVAAVPTFDKTFAQLVSWIPSDPNSKDTQLKYEIEIDNNSTLAAAWRPGVVTSSNITATIPANQLAQNTTFRMRIRTYDEQNATGTWSNYVIFSTSDIGSVTITNPIDDLQTGSASTILLGIQYNTSGASTISKYRIKMIRTADSTILLDTGEVAGSGLSMSVLVSSIPTDTPVRFDVYIVNSATQTTTTVSRLYTTSYSAPDAIVNLQAIVNGGQVDLTWTIPTPTGSRPLPESIAVYRADSPTDRYDLIATLYGTAQSFSDYIPQSGTVPQYYLISQVSTGSTYSNTATPGLMQFFGVAMSRSNNNPADPWDPSIMMFFGGAGASEKKTEASTKLQFQGRPLGVTVFGDSQERTLSTKVTVPFLGNPVNGLDDTNQQDMWTIINAIEGFSDNHDLVCFRDGRGRKLFCNIVSVDISDTEIGSDLNLDLAAVDYLESSF